MQNSFQKPVPFPVSGAEPARAIAPAAGGGEPPLAIAPAPAGALPGSNALAFISDIKTQLAPDIKPAAGSNVITLSYGPPAPAPDPGAQLAAAAAALTQVAQVLAAAIRSSSASPGAGGRSGPELLGLASNVTVGEAVNDFLRAKARAQKSDRYLNALRVSLKSFSYGRWRAPLSEVALVDLERWLNALNVTAKTIHGRAGDVSTFFNWCQRRGLVAHNPAAALELPTIEQSPPKIHTPAQAAAVLQLALKTDLNLCRSLAVRYFAGLRSAEAGRLEEKEINLNSGLIEVTALKSKTRKRRLVTIQPNLKKWLELGGKLPLHDINNRMRFFSAALLAKEKISWPPNVTRHSFVSYHLARFRSAAETALEAGHTEQMTFAHYRELVTPAAALEYFSIAPQ